MKYCNEKGRRGSGENNMNVGIVSLQSKKIN